MGISWKFWKVFLFFLFSDRIGCFLLVEQFRWWNLLCVPRVGQRHECAWELWKLLRNVNCQWNTPCRLCCLFQVFYLSRKWIDSLTLIRYLQFQLKIDQLLPILKHNRFDLTRAIFLSKFGLLRSTFWFRSSKFVQNLVC